MLTLLSIIFWIKMIYFILLFVVDALVYLASVIVGSVFLHSGCLSDVIQSLAILMVVVGSIVTLLSLVSIVEIVRFAKKQNRFKRNAFYRSGLTDLTTAFVITLWIFTIAIDLVYSLVITNGFAIGFDDGCDQVVTGFTIARLSLIGFNILSWLTIFLVRRVIDTVNL